MYNIRNGCVYLYEFVNENRFGVFNMCINKEIRIPI